MKIEDLKSKIIKYNTYSTIIIITIIILFSFFITYFTIKKNFEKEIKLIKQNYIQNQKDLMKNQINNVIKIIETLRKDAYKDTQKKLKILNSNTAKILKIEKDINKIKNILRYIDNITPNILWNLVDLNGNIIYLSKEVKDFNKNKKLLLIKKIKGQKIKCLHFNKRYSCHSIIFNKYMLSTGIYNKKIESEIQQKVISFIYNMRFGAKNRGYISVAKILNYKGGKAFAKVVALPVNPSMVGKLLNDDKKDAKGKLYRKEYLKIANTTKEGFVSYWFYKYSDKIVKPKISYVKLYKPWDWLIFTSVFIDDIDKVIEQKKENIKKEINNILLLDLILYVTTLIIALFIIKKENLIIKEIIEKYEKKIKEKNIILENLNKNLMQEVAKKTEELTKTMFRDNLTNLENREKLLNDLKDNFVAIININDFKEINDFYGIETGDKLLKEFGEFLNRLNKTYKLSADEYAIISDKPSKLKHITSFIINKLKEKTFKVKNDEIKINISVGIGKNLIEADIALKYAKERKKPIIVYNPNLPILKEFENNLKWKKIIDEVIKNDGVIPFVQAIIDNKTRLIKKYECLMRLKHNGTIYTPYFFLEIAKKTYQYETLQKIMIEKCFKKFSNLTYNFSINLSLSELKNDNFFKYLITQINKYNIANKLTIEILEDEELIQDKKIKESLKTLSNLGVKIAIDDFGSGYSNFIYLVKNLPINILKIDGTLIKDILKDEKLKKLIQKIVEIAKEFNLETIAEFVENEEIYKILISLKIDASQGYYFSKPFDINELN